MWRAGFSGSAKQIDAYQKMGLEAAVAKFLAPVGSPKMIGPAPKDGGNPIDPLNQWGHDCLWWLDKMVRTPNQGQERMTLNLHDHFATSNSGVGNTRHMLRQNKLLRSHAVGNFRDLLHDITHDPAMLLWLNGADSNKWAPNENYAPRGDGAVLPRQRRLARGRDLRPLAELADVQAGRHSRGRARTHRLALRLGQVPERHHRPA